MQKPEVDNNQQETQQARYFDNKNPGGMRRNTKSHVVPPHLINKYKRQENIQLRGIKTNFKRIEQRKKEKNVRFAVKQAARAEMLLLEEKGSFEQDKTEKLFFTQEEIQKQVDVTTATKYFHLDLKQFGPYTIDYTRNGRYLLIGGKKGHLASMDWMTKRLKCEINVMEETEEICWLHQETMFAAAQKDWVYMYDNRGVELHCIKKLNQVLRMEFLPYHFLLATTSSKGYLSWLDTSIGKLVADFQTKMGRLDKMCQNPHNATLALGHPTGVVSMWSPNVKEPLMKILCHHNPVRALAIDPSGKYMATGSVDRSFKIWDIRNSQTCLQSYKVGGGLSNLVFSQTGLVAASIGSVVEIYKDCCIKSVDRPMMIHREIDSIKKIKFCPFEDVLGIGHAGGFTSIIVPGAGEANFDALESNPFQTKSQRREAEVKSLLGKIPYDMIAIDPSSISQFNISAMKSKVEAKEPLKYLKPGRVDLRKLKPKGKTMNSNNFRNRENS